MMNRLRTISALRRFVADNHGSGYRLYMAAPMAAISAGNFARMMATSGKKRKPKGDNDQKNIGEKSKDSGAVSEEKDESCESSSLKERVFYLEEFPALRSDDEITIIFYHWCMSHDKVYNTDSEEKRRLAIFKDRVKFIEDINARNLGFRLKLDRYSDLLPDEYLHEFLPIRKNRMAKATYDEKGYRI